MSQRHEVGGRSSRVNSPDITMMLRYSLERERQLLTLRQAKDDFFTIPGNSFSVGAAGDSADLERDLSSDS